jgi:hypothetical protein
LLGPIKFTDKRFEGNVFRELKRYDRFEEIEETKFRSIRKIGDDRFELKDLAGSNHSAIVTSEYAYENFRKEMVDQASAHYAAGQFKRKVKLPDGSKPFCQDASAETIQESDHNEDEDSKPVCQDASSETIQESDHNEDEEKTPRIVFQNNDDEREKCLQLSLANALHYLGFVDEALELSKADIPDLKQLGARVLKMETLKNDMGKPCRMPIYLLMDVTTTLCCRSTELTIQSLPVSRQPRPWMMARSKLFT